MYPESTTDSPARLSLRQTGSPGMIYSARYGSPKRQLQFYRSHLNGREHFTFGSYNCQFELHRERRNHQREPGWSLMLV
ncbi:hypothetical protein Nmel_015828 [Mimus melanotis]